MSRPSFEELLKRYDRDFEHGSFEFRTSDRLKSVIRQANVPNEAGVYVISGDVLENVVYIGKAGTLKPGGWTKQRLPKRLGNRQGGIARDRYWKQRMAEDRLNHLVVRYWVTFDQNSTVLPMKAEADLAQAFVDTFGRLPEWNRGF